MTSFFGCASLALILSSNRGIKQFGKNTSFGGKEYNVDNGAAIIAALPTLPLLYSQGKYFVPLA